MGAPLLTMFSSSVKLVGKMRIRLSTLPANAPLNLSMPLQGKERPGVQSTLFGGYAQLHKRATTHTHACPLNPPPSLSACQYCSADKPLNCFLSRLQVSAPICVQASPALQLRTCTSIWPCLSCWAGTCPRTCSSLCARLRFTCWLRHLLWLALTVRLRPWLPKWTQQLHGERAVPFLLGPAGVGALSCCYLHSILRTPVRLLLSLEQVSCCGPGLL